MFNIGLRPFSLWIAAFLLWGQACLASGSWQVLEFSAYDDQSLNTTAFDVDHLGNVIGDYSNELTGRNTGFIRSRGGKFRDIIYPETGTTYTSLRCINSKGEAFGVALVSGAAVYFLYHIHTGHFERILFDNFEPLSIADRNESGAMVGSAQTGKGVYYSFVVFKTRVRRIEISGRQSTETRTINDMGQIGGYYSDASGQHGFIASATGAILVDDIRGPRGEVVFLSSLDNDGSFVARSTLGEGYWYDAVSGQGTYLQVAGRQGVIPHSLRSGIIVGSTYDLQTNTFRGVVMQENANLPMVWGGKPTVDPLR